MVKPEYKDPTVKEKLRIRREFEKIEDIAKISIVPTDLALLILEFCYGIPEDNFFDYNEVTKSEIVLEAFNKLFLDNELDKKK